MRNWTYTVVLIVFIPSLSLAQSLSSKGRFSVEFNKGCGPLTVNISSLDDFGDVTRLYSYLDPEVFTNDTTFTYDAVGSFQIIQVVGKDSLDGGKLDTLFIEVVAPQKPVIEATRCSGLEVSFQSEDDFYDAIRIYYSPTDSVTLTIKESSTYTFSTSDTQTIKLKGLFNNADEVCQEYVEEIDPIPDLPSPEIISASIKQLCRDSYALYITLSEVIENVNYRISLNQQGSTILFDGFPDSTYLIIQDIPFIEADYCIVVDTFDPCNNATQSSNQVCASPTTLSLSPFETLYSTYNESSIYINLDEVGLGTFEIARKFEGSAFQSRGEKEGSFDDPIGSSSRKYFYMIRYRDVCGEVLFNAETNPPLVDVEEIDDNRYEVIVTPANNSLRELSESTYQVGHSGSFSTEQVNSNSFSLNLSPENGGTSQILSIQTSYDNGIILNSNTQTLRYEFIVYVPSAFTPNGDGTNDLLEFFGVPSNNAHVNIYSRGGQKIYSSNDLSEGWDGRVAGKRVQSGTYFYEIFFETTTGDKLRQRGTFVLL